MDSVEKRAGRHIGDATFDKAKPRYGEVYGGKEAYMTMFYRIHFEECADELFELYKIEVPAIRSKRFANSVVIRTAREWTSLHADVFPEQYKRGFFKIRMNQLFTGKNVVHPRRHLLLTSGVIQVKCLYVVT